MSTVENPALTQEHWCRPNVQHTLGTQLAFDLEGLSGEQLAFIIIIISPHFNNNAPRLIRNKGSCLPIPTAWSTFPAFLWYLQENTFWTQRKTTQGIAF